MSRKMPGISSVLAGVREDAEGTGGGRREVDDSGRTAETICEGRGPDKAREKIKPIFF